MKGGRRGRKGGGNDRAPDFSILLISFVALYVLYLSSGCTLTFTQAYMQYKHTFITSEDLLDSFQFYKALSKPCPLNALT